MAINWPRGSQRGENAATAGASKSTPRPLRAPFRAIKSAKSSHKTPKCQWISVPAVSRRHGIYFNKMCISRGHATNNLRLLVCTKVCTAVAGECKPYRNKTNRYTDPARSHIHILIRAGKSGSRLSRFANTPKYEAFYPWVTLFEIHYWQRVCQQ